MDRTKDSHFRAMVHGCFGGVEWYYCVVAVGRVPAEMIKWIGARTEPAVPKATRPVNKKTGIQHRTSDPKQMREGAKRKERQMMQMEEEWRRGKTVHGYYQLKDEVEVISAGRSERTVGRTVWGRASWPMNVYGAHSRVTPSCHRRAFILKVCGLASSGAGFRHCGPMQPPRPMRRDTRT